jgi:hypothetical protein
MVTYGFTLRYANILVIPEVVEIWCMGIVESQHLFTYIRFHMSEQACVYLISYEAFLKGKHRVSSSCYGNHKVKKKIVGSLRKS